MLMSAVAACSLVGGEDVTLADADAGMHAPNLAGDGGRPVVEVLPPREDDRPPLDPSADPQTPLGTLRSRYFPIWTSHFDRAFPPVACDSAWELDAIAAPVSGVDASHYGNVVIMAVLGVMRYEFQISRALAEPSPLAQLCIAVGSVGPARAEALQQLKARIEAAEQGDLPGTYPAEVHVLAANPSAILAVACNASGSSPPDDTDLPAGSQGARLSAYLLRTVRGLEDQVVDISYRVSHVENRAADDCSGLPKWTAEWEQHVAEWIAEGQTWISGGIAVSVEEICAASVPESPPDCPADWAR